MLDFTSAGKTLPSDLLLPARQEHQYNDPHRPAYHFMPPANWMKDPNGLIYWNNQYHLFYQYNPNGSFWGTIHWGHAVSDDLIHWKDLPVALAPAPNGPDADGCWSGCAINNGGTPTLVYTGVRGARQLPCIATSWDGLQTWEKYNGNPVLPELPPNLDLIAFRDPALWCESELWYMIFGAGLQDVGGTALLFHSTDLINWEYLHPLTVGDINQSEPVWTGPLWECPQLISLGSKHLLSFGVSDNQPLYTIGQIGTYINHHFSPEAEFKLDFGNDYFYAPQTLLDQNGRAIMWGWMQEGRDEAAQQQAGWARVMSLPRILSIAANNKLKIEPASELVALRRVHYSFEPFHLSPQPEATALEVKGDCLEIVAEFVLEKLGKLFLGVRCSPDGQEQTLITYDAERQWLEIDTTHSSLDTKTKADKRGGPLVLEMADILQLHIFIDHSVIVVFANQQACISSRVYPTRPDSLQVNLAVVGQADTKVTKLAVWELGSIW